MSRRNASPCRRISKTIFCVLCVSNALIRGVTVGRNCPAGDDFFTTCIEYHFATSKKFLFNETLAGAKAMSRVLLLASRNSF